MTNKKCTFPKLGTKFHQFKNKKKRGLSKEKWHERKARILKQNPLW